MPNDKDTARALQKKYYGDPQGLAQHLVSICLNSVTVVREVFLLLDNFSTLDVGCRFLNLIPTATLLKMVKSKIGKAFGSELLNWLLNLKNDTSQPICPGVDFTIELINLKNAVDNSNPPENEASPYYTIDADIVFEADAIAALDKIAPLYFAKVGERFNVNSGTRTSYRQAVAMYDVYMSGDKTLHLYNRQRANELIAIIKNGGSKEAVIQKMTDLIQKYFDQGILMSDHQKAGAIDIDINGETGGIKPMTASQQKTMLEIATQVTGFKALLEKYPPHIHIKFK